MRERERRTRRLTPAEVHAVRSGKLRYNKTCASKHAFSMDKAIRMADRRSRELGEHIVPYSCVFCNQWHIGHSHRGKRRNGIEETHTSDAGGTR